MESREEAAGRRAKAQGGEEREKGGLEDRAQNYCKQESAMPRFSLYLTTLQLLPQSL